jgi:protein O-mannosyl-transferase
VLAALFAWHPLNVESLAWIAERKNVLSTFFGLLSLLAYTRYTAESGNNLPQSKKSYTWALGLFALGLMSKPMLVTLPFLMLLLDYWPLRRMANAGWRWTEVRRLVVEKVPFMALAALFSALTLLVQRHIGFVRSLADLPMTSRMENAVMAYTCYLGRTFWPINLAFFYPRPVFWPLVEVTLVAGLLVFLCIAAVRMGQKHPYVFTGWFWYVGTLIPVIGLVQSGQHVVADHYVYVPLLGIFIIIAWGAADVGAHFKLTPLTMVLSGGLVLTAFALRARDQLGYWQNDGTLFQRAIAVTKNNYNADYNLGVYLTHKGRFAEAISHFHEAIRIDPNRMETHLNLGLVLENTGRIDEAVIEYRAAVRICPESPEARFDLGCALAGIGRRDEAIQQFQQALRLKPDFKLAEQRLRILEAAPAP